MGCKLKTSAPNGTDEYSLPPRETFVHSFEKMDSKQEYVNSILGDLWEGLCNILPEKESNEKQTNKLQIRDLVHVTDNGPPLS